MNARRGMPYRRSSIALSLGFLGWRWQRGKCRRAREPDRLLQLPDRLVYGDGQCLRQGHRDQGGDDAEAGGRDVRPDQGRSGQSQGRHLVDRQRRRARPGRGREPDPGLPVAALLADLHDWARKQAEQTGYKTVGIYAGPLGYGYNADMLAKKNVPPPKCWSDLVKPEYKGEVQIANPNSSGTAYVAVATLVQLMGEDEAFKYLKKMHANVNQRAPSPAPAR